MSTGAQLRDLGIAQVLKHDDDWAMVSTVKFSFWLEHIAPVEFCIEDFRTYAESTGMPMPHHPNAWGAISKRFKKLIRTVGYTQSQRPSAHSRLTRTYQRA
tara:strand:- start:222 stop:524 length:303 start_codon:yes stop_codon:yes gene_type:complete